MPEEIARGGRDRRRAAGLQIQRNSEVVVTNLVPSLTPRACVFGDLDAAAAERPELVEPYLHTLVPTEPTKFTALHAAFRTGGTFLYVPATSRSSCRCRP